MAGIPIEIDYVPISQLKAAPYNPRKMPDDQMRLLMKGIEEFGVVDPIIVNRRTGLIVGGHQRAEAAARLNMKTVPVVYVDLDHQRERALNLALNKISGEWDRGKLKDLLEELDVGELDLELSGFVETELEELMTAAPPEEPVPPAEAPEASPPDEVECPQCGEHFAAKDHKVKR